jgi:hypothetical protein
MNRNEKQRPRTETGNRDREERPGTETMNRDLEQRSWKKKTSVKLSRIN